MYLSYVIIWNVFAFQIRLLPRLPLTEPEVLVNFMGMKDEEELLGIYGYSILKDAEKKDHYCVAPYPKKPPTTYFNKEDRILYHKYASPYKGRSYSYLVWDFENQISN